MAEPTVLMIHPDSPDNVVEVSQEAFERVYSDKGWELAPDDATATGRPRRVNPDKTNATVEEEDLNTPSPSFEDLADS